MQVKLRLDTFISSSDRTRPAEVKKLQFVFSAIDKYVSLRDKDIENLRVLDVGCGRGWISFRLASLGCRVRAFDIDESSVKHVRSHADRDGIHNLIASVDDGHTFNDEKRYDVVIASEVFEHVPEPSKFAASIARRMMKGSYLIVTIPNGYGPLELKNRFSPVRYLRKWNWLRRLLGKAPYVEDKRPPHCQFYTKKELVDLLSGFSLKIVNFAKCGSLLAMFEPLYRRSALLENIDIKLGDVLLYWLAGGWYFVFEMTE